MIKALHTRKLGYKFEFWIIDRNELVYIISILYRWLMSLNKK